MCILTIDDEENIRNGLADNFELEGYEVKQAASGEEGLKIVSEGIETEEQFETMKQLGISYIQGYYFSRPLSELEFISFMNQECDHFKQAYT